MTTIQPVVHHDAIDPAWMSAVLEQAGVLPSGRVTDIAWEPCGTGQLADSYRFTLSYDSPQAGPATLVGKFASADETSRALGQATGQYASEIHFYNELATTLTIATPKPIHAALDDDGTAFVLLMEDLAPARGVDQIEGCTPDEAALVLEQAAALHSGSWNRAELGERAWLRRTVEGWIAVTAAFDDTISGFSATAADLISEDDMAEAAKLVPLREAWTRVLGDARCLWHQDLRADNVLFDVKGGAAPVAVLDWQGVTYGRGTIDVAYFLATSLTTEDRRAHERDLVAHYHAGLVAGGVDDLSAEECWDEYRLLAVHPLQTGIYGFGAVKRTERGDRMWQNWIGRSAAATRDLDSFALLTTK